MFLNVTDYAMILRHKIFLDSHLDPIATLTLTFMFVSLHRILLCYFRQKIITSREAEAMKTLQTPVISTHRLVLTLYTDPPYRS